MPDLTQWITLLATSIVALACLSLGAMFGARRPGVALVAGWGLGCLVMTVCATLFGIAFTPILQVLAGLALCGGLRWRRLDWSMVGPVLLLGLPYLLIATSITPAGYDEYAHWLPNLSYIVRYDHFPSRNFPDLISIRPGYPHGTAFIGLGSGLIDPK